MGNSNRRSANRTTESRSLTESTIRVFQSKPDWSDTHVNKLIADKKLAPKTYSTVDLRDTECPICFLNFEFLNIVGCCKQDICTDCFVQLKKASNKCSCPFCGHDVLLASLREKQITTAIPIPVKTDRIANTPEESKSEIAEAPRNSYTTPEQEKNLRSISRDLSSSKTDRETLEEQIRNQRLQYYEEDSETNARRNTAPDFNSSYRRYDPRSGRGYEARSASMGYETAGLGIRREIMNEGHGFHSFTIGGRTHRVPAASAVREERVDAGLNNQDIFANPLQTLFGTRVTSLEQLEELMLQEALRQSANEVSPLPEDQTDQSTEIRNDQEREIQSGTNLVHPDQHQQHTSGNSGEGLNQTSTTDGPDTSVEDVQLILENFGMLEDHFGLQEEDEDDDNSY